MAWKERTTYHPPYRSWKTGQTRIPPLERNIMKAIVSEKYGPPDLLRLVDIEKPLPGENDLLVKVHAASLNQYDWHLLTADIFLVRFMGGGVLKRKNARLGADVAGYVEAVGKSVTQFRPGDEVFGDLAGHGNGSFAEYVAAPEIAFARKPQNLSFDEAAAVPMAAVTALQGLRDEGKIRAGQRVLINGASGGVGTFALQLAKHFGAEVTAVCSTRNADQARSLGADHVIDYTATDFTRGGQTYDLIFAANGYHTLSAYKRVLSPGGRYIMAGGSTTQIFDAMLWGSLMSISGGKTMGGVSAKPNQKDLLLLKEMLEAGAIKPVIDKRYPLHETADALRYLGAGHARGKVVITVAQ
jgi:NADPH:quinone reductase-like Zn-dependent oxidoreductase